MKISFNVNNQKCQGSELSLIKSLPAREIESEGPVDQVEKVQRRGAACDSQLGDS